jgi:HD-GYP domain-containing protein (c-di-GMP phosphodiesterase class II)
VHLNVTHRDDWMWQAEATRTLFASLAAEREGALEIARLSLEWWDGSGPAGLHGVEIPLPARVAAAAQAWCSLRRARASAAGHGRVLRALELCSGNRLDPALVAAVRSCASSAWPGPPAQAHELER